MPRLVIVALAVLAQAGQAYAAERETVALSYTAPAGCPDQAAVEAAIRARTPLVEFAPGAARTFEITIGEREGEFVGTLAIAGDAATSQELSAHHCDDLVSALALVTALAIDPTAVDVHATPPPAPPPPSPLPSPEPRAPAPPWRVDADAAAGLAVGVTSDVMPAIAIEGRIAPRPYVAFALAALVGYDRTALDVGAAQFVWTVARPSACWRPWRTRFEIDACAHLELGAVRASGQDIVLGQSVTRGWAAAGLHAAARWHVTPTVFIQLQLGGSVPFQRDRYLFLPSMTIHQTSVVTEWAAAGVGMHFR